MYEKLPNDKKNDSQTSAGPETLRRTGSFSSSRLGTTTLIAPKARLTAMFIRTAYLSASVFTVNRHLKVYQFWESKSVPPDGVERAYAGKVDTISPPSLEYVLLKP